MVLVLVGHKVVDEGGNSGLEGVGVLVRAVPGHTAEQRTDGQRERASGNDRRDDQVGWFKTGFESCQGKATLFI